jgi:hypothetical protein
LIVLWVGFRDGFVLPKRVLADPRGLVSTIRARLAAAKSDRSKPERSKTDSEGA